MQKKPDKKPGLHQKIVYEKGIFLKGWNIIHL